MKATSCSPNTRLVCKGLKKKKDHEPDARLKDFLTIIRSHKTRNVVWGSLELSGLLEGYLELGLHFLLGSQSALYHYTPPEVDRMWLWVDFDQISIYPLFSLLKGDYMLPKADNKHQNTLHCSLGENLKREALALLRVRRQ